MGVMELRRLLAVATTACAWKVVKPIERANSSSALRGC